MNCKFDCTHGLVIGQNTTINAGCRIDTRGSIRIGDNVSISEDVIILTADHEISSEITSRNKKVEIEDSVWIGTRSMILPGVLIGKGAVIAAGAVVTKEVKPLVVVAGIPAKFIKMRTNELDDSAKYRRLFQ